MYCEGFDWCWGLHWAAYRQPVKYGTIPVRYRELSPSDISKEDRGTMKSLLLFLFLLDCGPPVFAQDYTIVISDNYDDDDDDYDDDYYYYDHGNNHHHNDDADNHHSDHDNCGANDH
ncbi:unnamed protein product, partial [Mesorhabditis spiculigera]